MFCTCRRCRKEKAENYTAEEAAPFTTYDSNTREDREYKVDTPVVLTQAVLNTVSSIEGLDLQLMPASFKTLQTEFHWALQDLGTLVFYQSISQAVSGLVWGYLADRGSRVRLLAVGCCSWGVVTMLMATGTQYWQFVLLKILNGIAVASVGPVAQSLIADLFPAAMRGEQFGWLQLFLCGGCIAGALIGGTMANLHIVEAVRGWRLAFFLSGIFSVFSGLLVQLIAADPPRHSLSFQEVAAEELAAKREHSLVLHHVYRRCRMFLRATLSRTFLILLLEGICGYIPLHAFQFYTMYFQYIGMPDWQASVLTACPLIGGMVGSLFGGWLGDKANERYKFHGRPFVGQAATLLAIPLIYTGLLVIPRRPEFFGLYALDMLLLGFAIAWCPTGANRPILSEIVESDARASVFATQIVVEGSVAAMLGSPVIAFMGFLLWSGGESPYLRGMPLWLLLLSVLDRCVPFIAIFAVSVAVQVLAVATNPIRADAAAAGAIAESLFGYSGAGGPALRGRNIEALANALLVATVFPWTVCFFMYGLLHFTYEKDVAAGA